MDDSKAFLLVPRHQASILSAINWPIRFKLKMRSGPSIINGLCIVLFLLFAPVLVYAEDCAPEVSERLFSPEQNFMQPTFDDWKSFQQSVSLIQSCQSLEQIEVGNHFLFFTMSHIYNMGDFSTQEERNSREFEHLIASVQGGYVAAIRYFQFNYKHEQISGATTGFHASECLEQVIDPSWSDFNIISDTEKARVRECILSAITLSEDLLSSLE